jgi:ankyrin repeat protein
VIVLSQRRYRFWIGSSVRALLPQHLFPAKEISEKFEPPVEGVDDERATVGISTTTNLHGSEGTTVRRTRFTQSPPGDIWTAAIKGDLKNVVSFRKEAQQAFNVDELHPKYGCLLAAAARSGRPEMVAQFLIWGADPNKEGGEYHNSLQAAAHSGNIEVVRMLLKRKARDLTIGGYYGTAMNAAVERGGIHMVQDLIRHYPSPAGLMNVPGGRHGKALVAAAFRGQKDVVDVLLQYGADVNDPNERGTTALHAAAAGNFLSIVQTLLTRGSDPDAFSSTQITALHAACREGHEDVALALVERGASLQIRDDNGRLPLHEASKNGLSRLVQAILGRDASMVNAQDQDGNTALHHAAIGGHVEVTGTLLAYGGDVSIGDKYEAQPLFRAAGCHHADIVDLLLKAGADPNAKDRYGQIALHGPSETDDVRVQQLLIEAGSDINTRGAWNRTPLYEACSMGKLANVKLLLGRPEIDVNSVDDHHGTPICRALCSTDPRHQDQCVDPRIPLFMADHAPDLDVNLCGGLAVQEAARLGMLELFVKMLDGHYDHPNRPAADIHVVGGKYGGVLQAAAIGGNLDIVRRLLDRRVDVNARGGEYGTPLAAACAHGHVAVVRELLDHGADPTIRGGRYGSAPASVGRAEVRGNKGRFEVEDMHREIRSLLSEARGGDDVDPGVVEQPHLTDRWHDTTGGWRWIARGEM